MTESLAPGGKSVLRLTPSNHSFMPAGPAGQPRDQILAVGLLGCPGDTLPAPDFVLCKLTGVASGVS